MKHTTDLYNRKIVSKLSTFDLFIEVACFVKIKVNNFFKIKWRWFKVVITRRSSVLSLPL
jgi:hypothetical protein